jgi:hypothetical protein
MDFIVKSVGTTYRNWNFHKVDSPIDSYLYMTVVPWNESRMDIGTDYVLCSDEYYEKNSGELQNRVPANVNLSFYNYDNLTDDVKKDLNGSCGTLYHDELYVGITVYLRADTFKEVKNNISLNKFITNLSVDFKEFNEKDTFEYGASHDGSHTVWIKENQDSKRLDVDGYDISFRLYESVESKSYEEKEDEEYRKQGRLTNTIERAILQANDKTRIDFGARLFNELKPYLAIIVFLLAAIAFKIVL